MEAFQCSTLELVLLATVQKGVSSTYELLTQAGMSVGATSRVLQRLKSAGLMVSIGGKRRGRRFKLTPKGAFALSQGWERVTQKTGPVSFEVALRVLCLGLLFQDQARAAEYTEWAVRELRRRATQRERDSEDSKARFADLLQSTAGQEIPVSALFAIHRWIKSKADANAMQTEADTLEAAAPKIATMTSAAGCHDPSATETSQQSLISLWDTPRRSRGRPKDYGL
jgi:hypothetical protein